MAKKWKSASNRLFYQATSMAKVISTINTERRRNERILMTSINVEISKKKIKKENENDESWKKKRKGVMKKENERKKEEEKAAASENNEMKIINNQCIHQCFCQWLMTIRRNGVWLTVFLYLLSCYIVYAIQWRSNAMQCVSIYMT